MKIYLDDERVAPAGWIQVRWPDEAITYLEAGDITVISLDHDLGDDGRGTGYDVIVWIEEKVATDPTYTPPEIRVHSANSSARIRMELGIDKITSLAASRP